MEEEMELEYRVAFELIAVAGNSKAASMAAIDAAAQYNFEEAEAHLKTADEQMIAAHEIQTELLQNECRGQKTNVNIILVHAQDHLTTALMMRDQADIILRLYRTIEQLSKR